MAQQPKTTKARKSILLEEEEVVKRTDLDRFVDHVRQNPVLYAASAAFVLVCLLAGGLYGLYESSRNQKIQTAYAAALDEESPALAAANLEALAEKSGRWAPEVWYMLGEKSLLAQNFSKAENAFNVVIGQYPKSESAPKALDGLGFIHENRGDFQKALEAYRQIADNPEWAKTLVGLRQQFNIGRVLEKMEHFEAAKAAFEKQLEVFPGTAEQPSVAAQQARAALDRLKLEHPDLFPAEPEEEKTAPAEQSTAQSSEISGVAPVQEAPLPAEATSATPATETHQQGEIAPAEVPAETAQEAPAP